MDTAVITAIISALTTLIVSMGTWHISAKTARKKETEEMTKLIESYRDELRGKFNELHDEVTHVNATVQQQISIVEIKLDTLNERVDKHNNLVERTYQLEKASGIHAVEIEQTKERVDFLAKRINENA